MRTFANGRAKMFACILAIFLTEPVWAELYPPPTGNHEQHPPPLPMPSPMIAPYPAVPMPVYSYPTVVNLKAYPTVGHDPRIKPANIEPTHPIHPVEGANSSKNVITNKTVGNPQNAMPTPNVDWTRAVALYEQRFVTYQDQLDTLLNRHGGDWEALMKDPADKSRCEDILEHWGKDETQLEKHYSAMKTKPGVSAPPSPDIKTPLSHERDLDASDLE